MGKKGNINRPKVVNTTVMASSENDLDGISGKEFKNNYYKYAQKYF